MYVHLPSDACSYLAMCEHCAPFIIATTLHAAEMATAAVLCALPHPLPLQLCSQAVFLLIGKTSALTMNIAGVIKDWMLIFFSYYIFRAPVTKLNLAGYIFCCRCDLSTIAAAARLYCM
jgi:hypothetical protein